MLIFSILFCISFFNIYIYAHTQKIGPFLTSHGGGGHGWSPFHPEMMGSFIAFGPSIQQNVQLNTVRLVDIAPTIAKLLNIEMKNVEGRVLSEIFV